MADDPEMDVIPTKEVKELHLASDMHVSGHQMTPVKRTAQLQRSDLEDQYYKFKEENLQLKKEAKKKEDEFKRLSTKLSRLLREKKSMEMLNSPERKRDLELEEMIEDLQDKVRQLEKANSHLREKVLVAKQQVITQTRRPHPYSHIPPKVNSGNLRSAHSPYASSVNLRGKNLQNLLSQKTLPTPIPPYAISLLEEARNELSNLKMLVSSQKNEIEMYEQENDILKQKLRMKDIEFEEEINILKSQLTHRQRQHVQENLDLIRLHRELKQKGAKYLALQAQYSDLEEKMHILKLNHEHLLKEMDDITSHFKAEQKKNLELLGELQKAGITIAASSELQDKIKTLQKENDILRETNDKLIKSAVNVEKERTISHVEEILKEKITNLETSLAIEMKAKKDIEAELLKEKEIFSTKETAYLQLQESFNKMKSEMAELEKKVNVLKAEGVGFDELAEAVNLLRLKKEEKLVFANKISEEEMEELKLKLEKSESELKETTKELNNVREMLVAQCNINQVTQNELKLLTEKIEQQEKEFQTKLEEYSHLLDLRASRIQKLEKQLNDIAYGTQIYSIDLPEAKSTELESLKLSRGENVFEIHIVKVNFSTEGLKNLYSQNSKVFMTWNFYEFELQSTPVVSVEKSLFNFTAQYKVLVDDFFLYYMLECAITLELHESLGVEYRTVATCQLKFSDLLVQSGGKAIGTQNLIGISEPAGIVFGTLEYWLQLKIPMEEALKNFKEKLKAMKYIHSNKKVSTAAMNLLKLPYDKDSHVNQLHVKIIRGLNLKSSQRDIQPSAFCVYKFYDLPDQDTAIIPASNNPEFSDHRTFNLFIDSDLDKYINTEDLFIYVFDDNEPDITSHLGKAIIPLHTLSHNKPIKGNFDLQKGKETGYGSLEVLIYWQYEYVPAVCETTLPTKVSECKSYTVSENSASSSDAEVPSPKFSETNSATPVPKPRSHVPPKQTSTPVAKTIHGSDTSDQSPNLTPIHHADMKESVPPQPAACTLKFPSEKSTVPQKSDQEILEALKDEESDQDAENGKSYAEVSDEDKGFSHEDSEESESDGDTQSLCEYRKQSEKVTSMKIVISYLVLNPGTAIIQNASIKMLYVEYRFLDYPLEELETPISLPKEAYPHKIEYNFEKVFPFRSKDVKKWSLLSKMFTSDSPDSSLIKFTVVSEPLPEEQDLECEDVGYGSLDLQEIFKRQKDMINENIIIYDASDNCTEVGYLNVTIEALDVLLQLENFMLS